MNLFTKKLTLSILTGLTATSLQANENPNEVAERLIEEGELKTTKASDSKTTLSNELIRKQQIYLEASLHIQRTEKLLSSQNYAKATEELNTVKHLIEEMNSSAKPVKDLMAQSDSLRVSINQGWSEALYKESFASSDISILKKAKSLLNQAIELDASRKSEFSDRIERIDEIIKEKEYDAEVNAEAIIESTQDRNKDLTILMDRAELFYGKEDFIAAREMVSEILIVDPFHAEAAHLNFRIAKSLYRKGKKRQELLIDDLSAENSWKWIDPIVKSNDRPTILASEVKVDRETYGEIYKKLEIEIPVAKYQGESIEEVVQDLIKISKDQDIEGRGINIVFLKNTEASANTVTAEASVDDGFGDDGFGDDGFGDDGFGEEAAAPVNDQASAASKYSVHLMVEKIPLGKLIDLIAQAQGLNVKIEEHMLILAEPNVQLNLLETQFFSMPAGVMDIVPNKKAEDLAGTGIDSVEEGTKDWVGYFTQMGISFPPGAKVTYVASVNRLVVTNTSQNNQLMGDLIKNLNSGAAQINVESKIVEINWNATEELGVLWRWTGPTATNHPYTGDKILVQDNNPSLTSENARLDNNVRGIRTVKDGAGASDPVQFAADLIFGHQELQTLIRALDQSDTNELLSAPSVLTKSGETAIVRVVQERSFPEDWEAPEIADDIITPSAPTFGEARDMGFVLNVTPETDPSSSVITMAVDLQAMAFVEYDTAFNTIITVPGQVNTLVPLTFFPDQQVNFNYSMPILEARTIETEAKVWDGQTFTLGGLIREETYTVEDSIPYISDIPFIGRFFQNKGESSEKRSMLIFITARLIAESGLPLRLNRVPGLPDFKKI